MLSIGPMNTFSGRYYMDLANEDYYLDGGEPPGRWVGRGAEALGLTGTVDKAAFYYLMDGIAPDGSRRFVQDSAGKPHHPGWDLTFSAPKSVSVLWSQADSETRQKLQDLHHAALVRAIAYLEDQAAQTRRGRGGRVREPVSLIVAAFEHGTSRAQDPNIHTHATLLNVSARRDGSTGAVDGRNVYRYKMAAGAVYRAELSALLTRDMGLAIERQGNLFEVRGVPYSLVREFSKRRQQIEAETASRGTTGARASAFAALATRSEKQHMARETLFEQWHEVGRAHGFSQEEVRALLGHRAPAPSLEEAREESRDAAWDRIESSRAPFFEQDLVRAVAVEAVDRGVDADGVLQSVSDLVQDSGKLEAVSRWQGDTVYETPATTQLRQDVGRRVAGLPDDHDFSVDALTAGAVSAINITMTSEQRRAYHHVIGDGHLSVLDGWAGTDRMHVLKAARQAWEQAGYTVLGVSPTPLGQRELSDKTGIHTVTIGLLMHYLDPSLKDYLSYYGTQFKRFAVGKPTFTPDEFFARLDNKTVLVLDRAELIPPRLWDRVSLEVERRGSKLVASGDRRAATRHGRGGMFGDMCELVKHAVLERTERQRKGWARDAVASVGRGDLLSAVKAYAERGLVTISDDRDQARDQLLRTWCVKSLRGTKNHVIFAPTRADADDLNGRAQSLRLSAGQLGALSLTVDGCNIHRRDRVRFLETKRSLGIMAGAMGTVMVLDHLTRNIVVKLDNGKVVGVPTLRFKGIALGYAVPVVEPFDTTAKYAYVLMGDVRQDYGKAYLELSRASATTQLFADRDGFGEEAVRTVETADEGRAAARVPIRGVMYSPGATDPANDRQPWALGTRRSASGPAPAPEPSVSQDAPGPPEVSRSPEPEPVQSEEHSDIAPEARTVDPDPSPAAGLPRLSPVPPADLSPVRPADPLTPGESVVVPPVPVELLRRPPGVQRHTRRIRVDRRDISQEQEIDFER